ncbi:MAG TPA: polyphosphate kinase 1 [Planctomycetota bacterium]|jgi:polyphosphate kinase|nr:polyphosphate kinase 1 [Planctomycetota bacterium]
MDSSLPARASDSSPLRLVPTDAGAERPQVLVPRAAPAPPATPDLRDPALYLNRELSVLEFNLRVLEQAKDPGTPLLERLKFLTICSTNLDEFFEIRVAGLKQQVAFQVSQPGPDGLSPQQTLQRIAATAHALVEEQYRVLNETLLPALREQGIRILERADWTAKHQRWIRRYFEQEVLPVLTPVGLDPAHPFPKVLNKSLNFVVSLEGSDAFGRGSGIAVVQAPRSLPRLIALPPDTGSGVQEYVLLSSIVHARVGELFPGMQVLSCHQFRVTRNSDLWIDEEEVDDLLHALKGELLSRNYGDAVRLEVAADCSPETAQFLLDQFELGPDDLYRVNGPVNLHRLAAVRDLVDRAELKYPAYLARPPRRFAASRDPFEVIRRGDVLLHHPYDSFTPVIELVRLAADDPNVLAIKQTLYRTGDDSPLVDALLAAARNGKEVTTVIELRARFDEAANIKLATRLQEAGVKVVYGVVGYKAHLKAILIVRREGKRLRHYVHLGTGNYHAGTARAYTDFGLWTCDKEIGEDVHKLFMQLTGLGRVARLKKIRQAPFNLQRSIIAMIDDEAENARRGKKTRIAAKMNALSEPRVIQALYRASQAGVPIDLVVRGICCLRPGVPGVSDNIRVRSIVGRFLEHSRVFHFHADGKELTYCASADWMQRSFFSRVEACFPIEDARARARVLHEGIEVHLGDNAQAWVLQSDGKYRRARGVGQRLRSGQDELLARYSS